MDVIFAICIMIGCIYLLIKNASNKTRKENMSKIDFSKEKEYYREILKGYSPIELRYIDDFKIEYKRDLVAILLNLKLKKRIEIKEDKIEIINSDVNGLKKTEIYVMENIKNGKLELYPQECLKNYARDEAIEDGLIIKNSDQVIKKRIKKNNNKYILVGFILVASFIYMCVIKKIVNLLTIIMFGFLFLLFISWYICSFNLYVLYLKDSYRRTKKGEELNEKIEGLKQYISDCSMLNTKGKEELIIWEEYLIYSVIFNINSTKILNDLSKLIKIKKIRFYKE